MKSIKEALTIITSGCVQALPEEELQKKLASGKKLKVKLGVDPTTPDLHLGHTVVLSKLKQLQDLGHEIIFLIGDFTARIGDPTGKIKTRPPLSNEEIQENIKTYFTQVGRVVDIAKTTIRYNSEWLSKLSMVDVIALLSKVTVSRVIERDDFQKRLQNNLPIAMHELLYPLFQAYDSVALDADIEIGGTDQTFNLLMGRFLQQQLQKEAQVILTLPILEGINGVEKMSKSLGNAISLSLSARDAFAKLMSISDALMFHYAQLLLNYSNQYIVQLEERIAGETLHPMELKKEIAYLIVKRFWTEQESEDARKIFESSVQKKEFSHAKQISIPYKNGELVWIVDILKAIQAITTSSEAKRLISQRAIELNKDLIIDFSAKIIINPEMHLRVGKHKMFVLKAIL